MALLALVAVSLVIAPAAVQASEPAPLLEAGFENDLKGWNTAGVGEVAPSVISGAARAGTHSGRVVLTGSQNRSELILGGDGGSSFDPVKFGDGAEYWYGFSFNIQQMVYGHPGAHNLLMQFKSNGEGSPNFGLQLWNYIGDNGEYRANPKGLWSHGEAMGGERFLAPVPEDQWHDVRIHFRASSHGAGFYQVYLDGKLVDSRSNVSMIVPGHEYAYIKDGIYRNGSTIPGTSEIFLDAAKLGTSSESVLAGPPPAPPPPLLESDFEDWLAGWNTAGVGEVMPTVTSSPVRTGTHSGRFVLTGSQNRSELILGGDGNSSFEPVKFGEGAEYWYGFSIYIQQMVYGHPGAYNHIMKLKSEGEGVPNFGLQLWNYAGDDGEYANLPGGGKGLWSTGEAMGGERFLAPVSEKQWHDVAIHFRASNQGAGFYEVFLDGKLIDSRDNASVIVPGHSFAYIKNGIYRNGSTIPGTSEIFLDAAKLGTSFASVQPG